MKRTDLEDYQEKRSEAGIAPATIFHDIRRTVKTNMARAGVSKAFRGKLLDHAPQRMDAHYMALDENGLRQAMDRYTVRLDGQLTNVDQTVDQEEKRAS